MTLTELAGLLMLGTACTVMCLGLNVVSRAVLYLFALALAIAGGGLRPRLSAFASLFPLCGSLYIFKALLNQPVPKLVIADIGDILFGFGILATLRLSDLSCASWQRFQLRLHRTVLMVSSLGAVLGLAKLFYFNQGGMIPFILDSERGYPLGTSLRMDYNFYSLPLLLGVLSAFWLLKNDSSSRWCLAALLALPELLFGVLLSGSRRGLIAIACMVPTLTVWLLWSRRQTGNGGGNKGISIKALVAMPFLLAVICILNLNSLADFVDQVTSANSFSEIVGRWQTFENGTYSDSRMYYWTAAVQRFARFGPLDYMFGEGFAYVTELDADPEVSEDYPHNFLLSSMLYGGLLQTTCLIAMILVVIFRLARCSRSSGMFAAWYVLVILFLMTSCNSFFSSEIAIILTIIGLGVPRFGSLLIPENYAAVRR